LNHFRTRSIGLGYRLVTMTSISLTSSKQIVRRTLVAVAVMFTLGVAGVVVGQAAAKDDAKVELASAKMAPAVVETVAAPELMHDVVVAPASIVPVVQGAAAAATPKFRTIEMEVTAYCPCTKCCGPNAQGLTASGKSINHNDGQFVAADKRFAFGTKLIIPGYAGGKIVEVQDRGGAIKGNKLDVYFHTHAEALKWGRQKLTVTVVE
jgi:3D (Asp-Asp-Asp) domain-containing protein